MYRDLKRVKCKGIYGKWFYRKVKPNDYNGLEKSIYELYDGYGEYECSFNTYKEMMYFVVTGYNF